MQKYHVMIQLDIGLDVEIPAQSLEAALNLANQRDWAQCIKLPKNMSIIDIEECRITGVYE